jgi:hypothetical protein
MRPTMAADALEQEVMLVVTPVVYPTIDKSIEHKARLTTSVGRT